MFINGKGIKIKMPNGDTYIQENIHTPWDSRLEGSYYIQLYKYGEWYTID